MLENTAYDERSAGGIVFRVQNGTFLWLLVKTSKIKGVRRSSRPNLTEASRAVYKFPKGHLRPGEFLKQAALREVEEEGQVKARIIEKIGSNDYIIWDKLTKKKIVKKVTFFLMEYQADSHLRYFDKEVVLDRVWLPFDEASERLAYTSEKTLLRKAREKLKI